MHFAIIMGSVAAHPFVSSRSWVGWLWNYVLLESVMLYDMTYCVCWLPYQYGWNIYELCAFENLHTYFIMMSCLFILFAKTWFNMWNWGVYFTFPKLSEYDIVSYG